MREGYRKKIKRRIDKYCETNYEKINKDDMIIGKGLFNQRCQLNAVQQVKEHKANEVFMVVCLNDSTYPFVHFINKVNDKYIDNTLGWEYEIYNYYLIRRIDGSEYKKINDILMNTKDVLLDLHSNTFLNWLLFIDRDNVGI